MTALAEETPVAIVHDAATFAVMMATPLDLEDFALGLSLTEGVVASPAEVEGIDVVQGEQGVEARLWLAAGRRRSAPALRYSPHCENLTGCRYSSSSASRRSSAAMLH